MTFVANLKRRSGVSVVSGVAVLFLAALPVHATGLTSGCLGQVSAALKQVEGHSPPERDALGIPFPEASAAELSAKLGVNPQAIRFVPLASGSYNHVYDIVALNGNATARFPNTLKVPVELRGRLFKEFKIKQSRTDIEPYLVYRDRNVALAISAELQKSPETYSGISLAKTYFLGRTPLGHRVIAQEAVAGQSLAEVLSQRLKGVLPAEALTAGNLRLLGAKLLGEEFSGKDIEEIFAGDLSLWCQSSFCVNRLQSFWRTDPALVRVRELVRKIHRLNEAPALGQANWAMRLAGRKMTGRMPWSSEITAVAGDFNARNFLFRLGADHRYELVLFDF